MCSSDKKKEKKEKSTVLHNTIESKLKHTQKKVCAVCEKRRMKKNNKPITVKCSVPQKRLRKWGEKNLLLFFCVSTALIQWRFNFGIAASIRRRWDFFIDFYFSSVPDSHSPMHIENAPKIIPSHKKLPVYIWMQCGWIILNSMIHEMISIVVIVVNE